MSKNILYVIKRDNISEEAIKILESSHINFQPVTIELDGLGKFMWRDTRAFEVPSLLTATKMYCGLEEISKFARITCSNR